ncbi:MAG: ferrous iron transport protein B [bacterium]|nr:ferrous iron transport protein B [bacterium]
MRSTVFSLSSKEIVVALAGNPNSGKTTVFNALTGGHQHVGNYPGVTVEVKEGECNYKGYRIRLIDMPGTYSLTPNAPDEAAASRFLLDEKPDLVVDIVDLSNLSRNLYLTTQLMELDIPLLLCLNMRDIAKQMGLQLDEKLFSQLIGQDIVYTVGSKKEGIEELLEKIIARIERGHGIQQDREIEISYGHEIQQERSKLEAILERDIKLSRELPPRYLSLKLLEGDIEALKRIKGSPVEQEISDQMKVAAGYLESIFGEDLEGRIADMRYGFINGIVKETLERGVRHNLKISENIDKVLTHRFFGLPIFAAIMWLTFTMTFTLAETPMQWIEQLFALMGRGIAMILPEGVLQSLLVDGIIGGVGGVLVFLPNIFILFMAISILEDSGYLARAAFIMDKLMHKMGLHGKSFIPLLMGFGCSVPAYMASRTLESKRERLITMHVNTFMSCSARLPVYVLFCGAFWPEETAGDVMFSIYVLGILMAILVSKLLSTFRFPGGSAPFVMELPPYHLPTFKGTMIHMWNKGSMYLRKAGTIILAISIVMWALMNFPQKSEADFSQNYSQMITDVEAGSLTTEEKQQAVTDLNNAMAQEELAYSLGGRIGKLMEPVIKPLGFDWRLGIGIFSGFAAKEVVVATLGTVYKVGETDEESVSLRDRLRNDPAYSPLIAYAMMVFVLLYFPCMTAMVMFHKEGGSWKETIFQMTYTTALAYVGALVVYQGGLLLGFG